MRAIKVTYRAVFRQPIGILNPLDMRLPGDFPVELFERAGHWILREIATARKQVYERLEKAPSAEQGKTRAAAVFKEQIAGWQTWGIPPSPPDEISRERQLRPWELHQLNTGKVLWKEPEDFLHIIHPPMVPMGARIPKAACGAFVKAECFISNLANIEPSCPGCAEVWKKEYKR